MASTTRRGAWIVMFVDVSTMPATVVGAGIFSEPRPTIDQGKLRVVPLWETTADTYGEAAENAWQVLQSEPFAWLGAVRSDGKRWRVAVPS